MNIALNLLLGTPVIAGIAAAAAVVVCIAVVAAVLVTRRKKNKQEPVIPAGPALLPEPKPQPVEKTEEPKAEEVKAEAPAPAEEVKATDEIDVMTEELEDVHEELDKLNKELDEALEAIADEDEEAPAEEPIEEVKEEVAKAPAEEAKEEVKEAPVEEKAEEKTEAPAEEVKEVKEVKEAPAEAKPAKVKPVKAQKVAPEGKVIIRIRYNRSYTAKLIQSEDTLKNYYSVIKNELLSYGVKPRASWKYETFRTGRKLLVKAAIRGKTLGVYFALNPADYEGTKYKIKDVSSVATNAAVPTLYKIKNDRRLRYAKDLIAAVMAANGLEKKKELNEDYVSMYPYEELEPLIERKLVKLVSQKETTTDYEVGEIAVPIDYISEEIAAAIAPAEEAPVEEVAEIEEVEEVTEEVVEEVEEVAEPEPVEEEEESEAVKQFFEEEPEDEAPAEEAETADMSISLDEAEEILDDKYVEAFVKQSSKISDKSGKAIVNVDTLGKYFSKGEKVTVEEIRKRVPGIGKKVTYVKVLGRGVLDKPLTVEADDFSPAAIKMIVLTGGEVVRTKRT